MRAKLDAKTGLAAVFIYLVASIVAGLLAAILLGGVDVPGEARRVDALIDGSTLAYVLVALALIAVIASVFRDSRREIFFEPRPLGVSRPHYLYPAVLLGVTVWAFTGVGWGDYTTMDVALVVVASLAIAFNEEVVTRGLLLVGLRNRGVREWQVWLITTGVFSLLHAVNLLGGANLTQLLVTAASGTLYYASRRVTGNLFVPILLHASYDVGFFLLGGVYAPGADLPSAVLDIHLGAFLAQFAAAILFVTVGRGVLRTDGVARTRVPF